MSKKVHEEIHNPFAPSGSSEVKPPPKGTTLGIVLIALGIGFGLLFGFIFLMMKF